MPDIRRDQRIALIDQIENLLPQTQCTKCKTPGCRPYAEEIAAGAPINRCVPGGAATIADLAALLGKPVLALDPDYGIEPVTRRVAFIREAECIGCTKCIQACPVDAIVGAAKLMHTIITDECTGCDLCIPPCPVDCIEIHDFPKVTAPVEKQRIAAHNRMRFESRNARVAREEADKPMTVAPPASGPESGAENAHIASAAVAKPEGKSSVIAAALARTNLKKAERKLAAAQENSEDVSTIQEEIKRLQDELERLR
jgi:Na+-translocating ferredoxin:NAD+ oxidoreductase subunit B